MRKFLCAVATVVLLVSGVAAQEEKKMTIAKEETIHTVLTKHVGNKVTLKLGSGEEIGGTVRVVGDQVVHLEQVTGKEFFDAVVDINRIDAILVRTR